MLDKSHLGILRVIYFMILANVIRTLFLKHQTTIPCCMHALATMGKQSLPVFFAGTLLSFSGGIIIYQNNQNILVVALVNIMGIFLLWRVAKLANWIKTDMHKLIAHSSGQPMRSLALEQH